MFQRTVVTRICKLGKGRDPTLQRGKAICFVHDVHLFTLARAKAVSLDACLFLLFVVASRSNNDACLFVN
jgi:hypothetical protein